MICKQLTCSSVGRSTCADAIALQVGLHDVNQYVATGNVWVAKAPLDNQRFSFGAAYLDEGVYVIGGNHYCDANSDESCHTTA